TPSTTGATITSDRPRAIGVHTTQTTVAASTTGSTSGGINLLGSAVDPVGTGAPGPAMTAIAGDPVVPGRRP
ncbi:hypothetical protein, partial [Mycolicibacter engbaekii]|uniref:hypothetical protein n=1 Tax=Mycolicibacter engbaekii TaxID=188915 RepID=UPI001A98931E